MNGPLLLIAIFAGIIFLLYYLGILAYVGLFLFIAFAAFAFYKLFVKKFEPYESALVYRFGRLHRISPAGWTIVLPLIETVGAVVDLREQKEHILIPVITKEGLKVNIMALAYFCVNNARNAILNVKDYRDSLLELIESEIRDIAGEFTFTQLVVNVEQLEEILKKDISSPVGNWGLVLNNFQIEQIKPPEQVMQAMEQKRVSAENLEAQRFVAEARRIITRALGEGTQSFDDKTISYLYIKALENMKSAKMMLPAEFMGVMGGGKQNTSSTSQQSNGQGKSNLAQGMIAGTTFSKALNMISEEVAKDATIEPEDLQKHDKIRDINVNDVEGLKIKDVGPNDVDEPNNKKESNNEEAAAGFDSLDGEIDGGFDDSEKKNIP